MGDLTTHDDVLRLVHRELVHHRFADRFVDFGEGRTIVPALQTDSFQALARAVIVAGGSANVVAPLFDGLLVFVMVSGRHDVSSGSCESVGRLNEDCTVGLLIQRLMQDGGSATYCLHVGDSDGSVRSPRLLLSGKT